MAKKSARRHARSQSGCMWNFISIFDFRQGRSAAKLLTDRRRESKHGIGRSSSQKFSPGQTEKCVVDAGDSADDPPRASVKELMAFEMNKVKELMAVEMIKDQGLISPLNESGIKLDSKSEKSVKKKPKRKTRNHIKSCDVDPPELDSTGLSPENFDRVLEQKMLNNLDMEAAMEELVKISRRNTDGPNNHSGGSPDDTVEKLVAALKLFMEERLSHSKHSWDNESTLCSEEFMDALQTLSAHKGLFLKLLRDQNSALVTHFRKLVDAHADNNRKPKLSNTKPDELSSHKHWGFFRRSKSVESNPLEWDKDYLSPSRIVILKPGRAVTQGPVHSLSSRLDDDKAHGNGNPSYFSFTNFKRKLLHAMGKERQVISWDRLSLLTSSPKQHNGKSSPGWSSPNRNHFYTERFALFSSGLKPKERSSGVANDVPQVSRLRRSNIYIEAKKHLLDVLKNGDKNAVLKDRHFSKSLGRILAFPDYNGSPCCSPQKSSDNILVTPQMRFSPLGVANDHASLRQHHLEIRSGGNSPSRAESLLDDDLNYSSRVQDTKASKVLEIEEVAESGRWEEEEMIVNISSELSTYSFRVNDAQEGESRGVENEESDCRFLQESLPSLKSESFEEVRILSPPMVSPLRETYNSYHVIDKSERPSPVSVLESLFMDDDISPASTISRPVEKEIQPLHIYFEEQPSPTELGICTRISSEDKESAFEYVEAVLLGSGLNWDEFLPRWISSDDVLDPSLFDEVELFSSQPRHDQRLLFDSANEALKDICETYFGCFFGISDGRPNTRPVPKGMDLIHETWVQVERRTVDHPNACTLEGLINMDLGRSGNWMELRLEVEVIGFIIEEAVFDELVEDSVLHFANDASKYVLGSESETIQGLAS